MSGYRLVRRLSFVISTIFMITGLSACGPTTHAPLPQEPQETAGSFGRNGVSLSYRLTASTNCVRIGEPITFTLTIANETSRTYTDSLTTSIIDLEIPEFHRWYWSESVAPTEYITSLPPKKAMTIQWIWEVDPVIVTRGDVNFSVQPILRYRDPQTQRLTSVEGGGYLLIDVDRNTAGQACS